MLINSAKRVILFTFLLSIGFSVSLLAQGDHGVVNGRVTDAAGARVPNAPIQIVEESTQITLKTKSNATGEYAFPSLVPGKYTITVSASGFNIYKEEHVQVDLGITTQIDLPLQVGGTDTTVTVNGQSQQLNYDSADLGIVIEEKSVTDLPLVYGNAFSLENLAPGVVLSGVNPNIHVYDSGTANVSINGSMFNSIDYKLDGAADNRVRTTAFTPNTESISQYRMATSTYDASQGHASGGFTNVQAKSGTDHIHGSLFGYYQNPNINANSWLLVPTPTQVKPTFVREGFAVGGPLLRRKLFIFGGFEHSRQSNPNNGSATVPTQAEVAGDFSALYALDTSANKGNVCGSTPAVITATPNAYQLFDPNSLVYNATTKVYSRLCIPGNNVATYGKGIDPVAAQVLKYYPAPNGGTAAVGTYAYALGNKDSYTGAIVRLDYNINAQQQMYMHLVRSSRLSQPALVFVPVSTAYLTYDNYGMAIGHSIALSPTLVVSSVASYTRFTDYNTNPVENQVTPTSIGMPSYLVDNLPHSARAFPRFDLTQYTSTNQASDFQGEDDIWLGNVSVSKQLATHFLHTGIEYRRYNTAGQSGGTENGDYASNGNFATQQNGVNASSLAGAGAGFSIAELQMGVLSGGTQTQNSDYFTRATYWAFYLQDDWRATRRLTVNLGLRWEGETPTKELNGKEIAAFDFNSVNNTTVAAAAAYVTGTAGTNALLPATINPMGGAVFANTNGYGLDGYSAPKYDFSPRIGFAFAVTPKTVIRGGFGLFFDSINSYYLSSTNSGSTTTVTLPQQGYSQTSSVTAPAYSNGVVAITSTLDNPFPTGLTPVTGSGAGVNTAIGQDIQFYQPHPHTPYNERFNFGIQHQFGQFVAQINYVGNHGVHTPTLQTSQGTNYGGRDFNAVPNQYLSTYTQGLDQHENSIISSTTVTNPFYGIVPANSANGLASKTVSVAQLLRPRPEFGRINAYTFDGEAIYHSLQLQVQRRFSNGFSTTQAFTYSKSLDATNFLNPGDAAPWYGISPSDRPLRYSTSVIYELPWGRNRHWLSNSHGVVAQVVGGWQVQGVYQIQSGAPLSFGNVIYYGASPGDSHWSRSKYKATQNPATGKGGFWFDPTNWLTATTVPLVPGTSAAGHPASSCPAYSATNTATWLCSTAEPGGNQIRVFPPRYGNLRSDNLNQADVGVQRTFQIWEFGTLQFRAEAINVLNHPVYSAPNTDPTNTLFGQITGQGNASRVFQFAGFFRF